MNFKTEQPEVYQMMGEYYKLIQELYEVVDIKVVLKNCDDFSWKWMQKPGTQYYLADGLVQGILTWKEEEIKNGKTTDMGEQ